MSTKKSKFEPFVFKWRIATMEVETLPGQPKEYESHSVGPLHIHEVRGGLAMDARALCGWEWPSDTNTASSDVRPAGLKFCPACETLYKRHPLSAWAKWTGTAVSLLLAFVLLACLSPAVVASTLTPTAGTDPASTETAMLDDADPQAEPTAEKRSAPECVVVLADSLHVRDMPDFESGAVTGYLFFGDIVRVLDRRDGWVLTRQGWSNGEWMAVEPCP